MAHNSATNTITEGAENGENDPVADLPNQFVNRGRPRGPILSHLVCELRAREEAALVFQVFQGVVLLTHQARRRLGLGGLSGLRAMDAARGRSSLEGSIDA